MKNACHSVGTENEGHNHTAAGQENDADIRLGETTSNCLKEIPLVYTCIIQHSRLSGFVRH